MSKKLIAIICILAACALFGVALLIYEWDARQLPPLVTTEPKPLPEKNPMITEKPLSQQTEPEVTPIPLEEEKPSTSTSKSIGSGTIIIRGKAFPYKNNIAESTLKKNIGWMDSSARPGDQGVCVFMGHRNGQLRILKDVAYGDVITIVDEYGFMHDYTVITGEVIESGTITHTATDQKTLVLITCYPFYYSGSAPHQYKVTAIIS